MFGEFLDRDATVTKNPFFAVDKRDRALAGTGVPVAAIEGDQTGLIA